MTLVQDSSGLGGGGDGMGGGGLVGVPAVPVGNVPSTSAALVHMQHHQLPGGGGGGGSQGYQSYPDPSNPSTYSTIHPNYTPPVDLAAEYLMPLLRQSPKYQDQLLAMLDGYFSTEQLIIGTLPFLSYLVVSPYRK